jgi:hypothetical protein
VPNDLTSPKREFPLQAIVPRAPGSVKYEPGDIRTCNWTHPGACQEKAKKYQLDFSEFCFRKRETLRMSRG